MSLLKVQQALRSMRDSIRQPTSIADLAERVTQFLLNYLGCERVLCNLSLASEELTIQVPCSELQSLSKTGPILSLVGGQPCVGPDGAHCNIPIALSDHSRARVPSALRQILNERGLKSWAAMPITVNRKLSGILEIHFCTSFHRFSKEELLFLEQAASHVGVYLEGLGSTTLPSEPVSTIKSVDLAPSGIPRYGETYQRLARFGNVVIVRTNKAFKIEEVVGDVDEIVGAGAREVLTKGGSWSQYVAKNDLKRVRRLVLGLRQEPKEIREEIRILAQGDRPECTLLIRGMPLFEKNGELAGWEGFAVDITEKKVAEEKALQQKRRIEALYEIARSSQMHHDPAIVMLKGLRAIIQATESDCGLACFYDRNTDQIEIVALEGLSPQFVYDVQAKIRQSGLVRHVIEKKEAILSADISVDPRGLVELTHREGLKSGILAPLLIEENVIGVVVVYCRKANQYDHGDLDLVCAAASQMAISTRQAEFYALEKQHSDSLAALYRISHELSKYVSVREVAERAFPLIQKEFSCKRMWLGILNEQGSHIVGQAGFGPGVRKRLVNIQIELYLRHDFLDEALRTKQPVIVREGQELECSGLNTIMERLKTGTLVIVPLISLAQVVGVLVLEPTYPSVSHAERKLALITNMANEIATVILARRFETKMAEADKMRMAGMLAAGVAHNFNNLLQAVMGQASLLEMQLPKDSPLVKSARMIIEAAGKGASLITQLLSFSSADSHKRRTLSLEDFLRESGELYKSILGSTITFELEIGSQLPHVFADFGQLQQVMSNLLVNAKEALAGKSDARLTISVNQVKLRSGEIDPDLAPGAYVRIDVEDNGIGMDAERQVRCFEPFYSSKNVDTRTGIGFSGSGLGLSSAYSIMKQHDGLIAVRSTPGLGTVFSLYLPLSSSSNVQVDEDVMYATLAQEKMDVLLFGLEDSVQHTLRPVFEALGLRSVAVLEVPRALEVIKRPGSIARAVLVDVDGTGYESLGFLRSARKELADVLLIIITTDPRRWTRLVADLGKVEVIEKPLGIWGIHALARRILSGAKATSLAEKVSKEVIREDGQQNGDGKLISEEKTPLEKDQKQ